MLDPHLILRPTTPAGGDLYAHLYPIWLMREELLPSGRIAGWSQGWFGGFPAFYFYFPLPAVAAASLSSALGLSVAMKVTTVVGLLALPMVTYYAATRLGLSRYVAGAAGVAGGAFVFMQSFSALGGNIYSTLVGEYAYSWAFAGSILYLGLLAKRDVQTKAQGVLPGAVLAGTCLSHILGCVMAVAASLAFLGADRFRRVVLRSWMIGFGLTGFWSVPFIVSQGYRGEVTWLSTWRILDLLPLELWFWIPGALVGFLILRRRDCRAMWLFGILVLLPVLSYLVPHEAFHKGRLLPYAFWSIHVLGGIAIGWSLEEALKKKSRGAGLLGLGLLGLVVALFLLRSPAPLRELVSEHFGGTEVKEEWPDFQAVMSRLSAEPGGRVFSEDAESLTEIGSTHLFALVPYWTGGHTATLTGLWLESSLGSSFITRLKGSVSPSPNVSPYRGHPGPLDFDLGIRQLQVFGVSHFVTVTDAGAALADKYSDLEFLSAEGRFRLYRVRNSRLVQVAAFHPSVFIGEDPDSAFQQWFENPDFFPHWLLRRGPSNWPQVKELPEPENGLPYPEEPQEVWDVSLGEDSIAFRTQALGIPHLVKVSYFPNWRVEGGEGPFLAAPSLMVVIPTREHVVLRFSRHWAEKAGLGLSCLTVLLVAWVVVRGRVAGHQK